MEDVLVGLAQDVELPVQHDEEARACVPRPCERGRTASRPQPERRGGGRRDVRAGTVTLEEPIPSPPDQEVARITVRQSPAGAPRRGTMPLAAVWDPLVRGDSRPVGHGLLAAPEPRA